MSLLSKTITNLFNGVSQQPTGIRLDSQHEIQENSVSSLTEGLKKRPPTVHIAKLNTGTLGNAYHHLINRDPTTQYVVQITNGDLKVFDLLGNQKTVLFPDGKAYLTAATPEDQFTCLTIADYTFVVNKNYTVTGTTTPGTPSYDSLVYVKAGNYSTDYQIKLNGTRVAEKYTSATDPNDIGTAQIAEFLRKTMKVGITGAYYQDTDDDPTTPPVLVGGTITAGTITFGGSGYTGATASISFVGGGGSGALATCPISAGQAVGPVTITNPGSGYTSAPTMNVTGGGGSGATGTGTLASTSPTLDATWAVTRAASSLLIQHVTGTDYKITTQDSGYNGDTVLKLIKGEIQAFSNLPTVAPANFLVKVRAGSTDAADYYVKFVPSSSSETFGPGTWVESQFDSYSLNATTMPFTLIDNGDGTFTFKKGTWNASTTGGVQPSFVGQTIQDVVFYKNRLGILAKENVVFSENGRFFNFYRTTARTILDTDPIDVAASSNVVSKLKHGIPFNDQLLLFSDNVQFALSGGDALTPKTVAIAQTTAFETALAAKPIPIGKQCLFNFVRGSFSGVKEYYVNKLTNNFDANDITSNVPKYIPGTIKKFSKSGTEDIVVALADGDRTKLYVHKFYWNNDEKLQASWSVFNWTETVTVLFAEFINSVLYLVMQRADGVYLEKMNLASGVTDSSYVGAYGSTVYYNTLVDRKTLPLSVVYNSSTGTSTVTFPYPLTGTPQVVTYTSANDPGALLPILSQTTNAVVVAGNQTTASLILGQPYTQRVRLSEPVVRQQNQSGQSIAGMERCQIHSVKVHCQDTGFFQVEVTPLYRSTTIKKYGGALHSLETTIGLPNVSRDKYLTASVMSRSNQVTIDLTNSTHLPSSFIGLEWLLQIVYKNRKV